VLVARFLAQKVWDWDLLSLLHLGIKLMVDGIYRRSKSRGIFFRKTLETPRAQSRQPCKPVFSPDKGYMVGSDEYIFGNVNFVHLFPGLR